MHKFFHRCWLLIVIVVLATLAGGYLCAKTHPYVALGLLCVSILSCLMLTAYGPQDFRSSWIRIPSLKGSWFPWAWSKDTIEVGEKTRCELFYAGQRVGYIRREPCTISRLSFLWYVYTNESEYPIRVFADEARQAAQAFLTDHIKRAHPEFK